MTLLNNLYFVEFNGKQQGKKLIFVPLNGKKWDFIAFSKAKILKIPSLNHIPFSSNMESENLNILSKFIENMYVI